MRVPQRHKKDHEFGAMTPMIDIVFLLLIFFVVTASSQVQEEILPTNLQAQGSVESLVDPVEEPTLEVEIWLKLSVDDADSTTVVDMNGTLYRDLEVLKDQLRTLAELGPENPVILDIAGDVPLGDVVDIYDTSQAAGFESVNFAVDAPNSN
ncbi:biopolymer transporter ExbD [Thalassoglobus sp. JC818]|uniref:ExbD/TolR family protein n=1 Tax=Thalassoglobus sp. JC818 TaxID=3232136 RepID=UPI003458C484